MGEDFKTVKAPSPWLDRLYCLTLAALVLGGSTALNRCSGTNTDLLSRVTKLEGNVNNVNAVMDQNAKEINGFAQMVNGRILTVEQKLGIPPPPPPPAPAPAPAPTPAPAPAPAKK